ncbi:DUF5107 domain-containing protein [Streptomyces sp. NRRL F-5126]|uniref:DUF5107 domain-containing protein n=1 Tax=Streptomyces sp. NRRL F-5126 TaxID=1463857 RepID=UPI0004C710DD|nr:DUF5107 domain-containing protein [Streptomyces sp. NRRL F-5126]
MATAVRRAVLTLPAASVGPENPLPPLLPLDEAHTVDQDTLRTLPPRMARQARHAPLRSPLPARILDGYGRQRTPARLDALVIENDRLRATVLPSLGGRVHSLVHKETGRRLIYRNPVFQPASFALNGAWFSGGIEWNIGATGHSALSCLPVHAAVATAPDGGPMLRLWEWERLRDVPFQVDLWLPEDADFLYAGVRIRNPHDGPVPVYWWSNTAVEQAPGTRVLVPAEEAWHYGYERSLRRVPVPRRPLDGTYAADWFYDVPDGERKWIAAVGADGRGLVQTSTDGLPGRKLFAWGAGPGGRRWQEWLTEPGTPGYAEIQAGLARTQLEHVPLEGGGEFSWLEAYGPLDTDPAAVHGTDPRAACAEAAARLEEALPRTAVEAAYTAWLPYADVEPVERLATGSGWGALEVARGAFKLPGTPFGPELIGPPQEPWAALLAAGALPAPEPGAAPYPSLVARHWRDMLETAPADAHTEYHLGVAQWHAGDMAQAVRSWERGLACAVSGSRWPLLRCLAVADRHGGHQRRAAERYAAAVGDAAAPEPALVREAVAALLAAGQPAPARTALERLPADVRESGAFRLAEAELLLAEGRRPAAREILDAGFEVADLREGAEALGELWERVTGEPLPAAYDFRMRPATN